jgi:hypothetical protein
MSVYITHTHRQLRQEQDWQDNYTKEQAKNIYVRALVYSTKDIDMVLFDRPPESISNIGLERSGSWSTQVEWKKRKRKDGRGGGMVPLRVNIALA